MKYDIIYYPHNPCYCVTSFIPVYVSNTEKKGEDFHLEPTEGAQSPPPRCFRPLSFKQEANKLILR